MKLRQTISRIINEGSGGLICIILCYLGPWGAAKAVLHGLWSCILGINRVQW